MKLKKIVNEVKAFLSFIKFLLIATVAFWFCYAFYIGVMSQIHATPYYRKQFTFWRGLAIFFLETVRVFCSLKGLLCAILVFVLLIGFYILFVRRRED